ATEVQKGHSGYIQEHEVQRDPDKGHRHPLKGQHEVQRSRQGPQWTREGPQWTREGPQWSRQGHIDPVKGHMMNVISRAVRPLRRLVKSDFDFSNMNDFEYMMTNMMKQFDVYTMETAMPKIDWDAIEAHLKATKEEERRDDLGQLLNMSTTTPLKDNLDQLLSLNMAPQKHLATTAYHHSLPPQPSQVVVKASIFPKYKRQYKVESIYVNDLYTLTYDEGETLENVKSIVVNYTLSLLPPGLSLSLPPGLSSVNLQSIKSHTTKVSTRVFTSLKSQSGRVSKLLWNDGRAEGNEGTSSKARGPPPTLLEQLKWPVLVDNKKRWLSYVNRADEEEDIVEKFIRVIRSEDYDEQPERTFYNHPARRRNDREEIRRKLAMGFDEDQVVDKPHRKPSLHSRLQSGMNLQICFMNETASDCESQCSDTESTQDRDTDTSSGNNMNVAQLQVIVNDLHTQIESLNEDLVTFLMERDDLHMEQDSMLVDIEDLTKHIGAKEMSLRGSVDSAKTTPASTPPTRSKSSSLRLKNMVKK
ncbi:Schwannomin-interacting protein 1-like 1, partial [Homarus americanus]